MTSMMRWLLLVLPVTLAACNTVAGFGQDMAATGRAQAGSSRDGRTLPPPGEASQWI